MTGISLFSWLSVFVVEECHHGGVSWMVVLCENVYLSGVGSSLHIKYIVLNMNVGPNTIHTIPNEHAEQSLVLYCPCTHTLQ